MNIYIGNLSRDVTEEDLRQTFQAYGTIDSVSIIKDKFSGISKGFAFIEMPVKEEAEAAMTALKGKELKGRSLDCNEARPREERKPNRGGGGGFGRGRGKGRSGGGDRRGPW
jgi:RNA recognition motif-containing protein